MCLVFFHFAFSLNLFKSFTLHSRRIWLKGELVQNTYVQFEHLLKCFIFLKMAHGYAGKYALQIGKLCFNFQKTFPIYCLIFLRIDQIGANFIICKVKSLWQRVLFSFLTHYPVF